MNQSKKTKGAEAIGVKIKVSKALDKFSGKTLFPAKLKKANSLLSQLKTN